jgi:hypothetical protein
MNAGAAVFPRVLLSARTMSILLLTLIPPAILAAGWYLRPMWAWITVMLLLAGFTILVGHYVVGLWRGAFIDDRNKISLSRFQTVLWTVLVIAGFLAAALHNVRSVQQEPLSIALPPQLWGLLGISLTTLVGSTLIKSEKSTKDVANVNEARAKLGTEVTQLDNSNLLVAADNPAAPSPADPVKVQGVLTVNSNPNESRWADMFQAEEVGSARHLDFGKIQMFYFTIILVFAYGAAVARMFAQASGKIGDFPALDNSMVALLGISQAAYLANKSISRTDTS